METLSMLSHSEKSRSAVTDENEKIPRTKLWLFTKPKRSNVGNLFQFITTQQGIASSMLYRYDGTRFGLISGNVELVNSPRRMNKL